MIFYFDIIIIPFRVLPCTLFVIFSLLMNKRFKIVPSFFFC